MKKLIIAAAVFAAALFTSINAFAGEMTVECLDVGQADATLITCDGHSMLIDGGKASDSGFIYSCLRSRGIKELDYIVCTHDDSDHVGGLPAAVTCVSGNVGTVLAPNSESEKGRFQVLKDKLSEHGVTVTAPKVGHGYGLGGATVRVLYSPLSMREGNESSMVIKVTHGKNSVLFTGDASAETEKKVLGSIYDLKSTVLHAGHHGSDTATCEEFLKKVSPAYAVISTGAGNGYALPSKAVLDRLSDAGIATYRTDNNGNVTIKSDGESITVITEKDFDQKENFIAPSMIVADNGTDDSNTPLGKRYVLNTHSMKFHYPSCDSAERTLPENRMEVIDTRENLITKGYDPCKNCKP